MAGGVRAWTWAGDGYGLRRGGVKPYECTSHHTEYSNPMGIRVIFAVVCKLKQSTGFPTHSVTFSNTFVNLDAKSSGDKEKKVDTDKGISSRNHLTPLDMFRCGVGYLSVSDLTAQFWCEQQMEYNFLAPEPRPETEQMKLGKSIHLARGMQLSKLY